MSLDGFWSQIDQQIDRIEKEGTTAQAVTAILNDPQYTAVRAYSSQEMSETKAFFAGSGGDRGIMSALREAGWSTCWAEASYHYAMRGPDGKFIEYVEGDVYITDHQPRPLPNGGPDND